MATSFPTPRGWLNPLLATSALLYRISWPRINSHPPFFPHSSWFSLTTKFIFVFSALSCFTSLFPAMANPPKATRLDCRGYADQFMYYTAALICMLVTTINYLTGVEWALDAIDQYFTRGYSLDDPSRFNRIAVLLSSCVVVVGVLIAAVLQWMLICAHWLLAYRALRDREVEGKGGQFETVSPPMREEKPAHLKAASS